MLFSSGFEINADVPKPVKVSLLLDLVAAHAGSADNLYALVLKPMLNPYSKIDKYKKLWESYIIPANFDCSKEVSFLFRDGIL